MAPKIKKTNKEEDMICTGQSPFIVPPAAYAMDVYQAYMQGVMNFWMAYSRFMTVPYWSAKDTAQSNVKTSATKEDSE